MWEMCRGGTQQQDPGGQEWIFYFRAIKIYRNIVKI